MAVLFDSALTAALGTELQGQWAGHRLEAVFFDEEPRQVRLEFDGFSWIWLLHPRHGVLAPVPEDPIRGRRRDRGVLGGRRRVEQVVVAPDTRRLELMLVGQQGAAPETLVFDLATNRWNALYVAGRVRAILHRRLRASGIRPGASWNPPDSERVWAAKVPTKVEWNAELASLSDSGSDVVGRIAYLSGLNRSYVFPENVESDLSATFERYTRLREALRATPPEGWLIPHRGRWQPYPLSLGHAGARAPESLLDAFAELLQRDDDARRALELAREDPDTAAAAVALETRRDRAARKLHALEVQLAAALEAPELRDLGHLLLARKASVPGGAREVRLESFSGDEVVVKLDPKLDAVGNAEAYYQRARRLDRATRELPARIAAAQTAVARFDEALIGLGERGLDPDLRAMAGMTADGRQPATQGPVRQGQRLPYRVYRTTSGLEIRAGRSARDNDSLTFRHASPDDIWMHVREAPGSHVVLRWNRRDQNPPQRDLTEAAVVAAVLSQARGSGLVPVSWTRRKYVRKPRKAGPGSVVTQRTQTIFVEPDLRLADRLAVDPDDPIIADKHR